MNAAEPAPDGGRHRVDELVSQRGRRLLQVLFVPTVLWAIVVFFAEDLSRLPLDRWAEQSPVSFYGSVVGAGVLAMLALGLGWTWTLRRWPALLRVPSGVSNWSLVLRILVFGPFVAIVVAVVSFVAWWVLVVSGEDPSHSQYGLSAWWAGLFHAVALTPMGTVLVTWVSTRRDADG